MGAMIVAGAVTLAIYMGVLVLEDARLAMPVAAMAAGLATMCVVAWWHDDGVTFGSDEIG